MRLDNFFPPLPVDHLIVDSVVEGVVEPEVLVVKVLGEIHLCLGFMDDDLVFVGHRDDIHFLLLHLLGIDWSLTDTHLNKKHNI